MGFLRERIGAWSASLGTPRRASGGARSPGGGWWRAPLRAARDAFDALGIEPWAQRARRELRASGETSRRRASDSLDDLTPQELQIAQLVAQGLSNRAIGDRLYLSHRTVESHLYRVFPKLGVTSRSQLAAALGPRLGTPA